jgi:hypothetical protein
MNNSSGKLEGSEFYPVRERLYKEARPDEELINLVWRRVRVPPP